MVASRGPEGRWKRIIFQYNALKAGLIEDCYCKGGRCAVIFSHKGDRGESVFAKAAEQSVVITGRRAAPSPGDPA
jgi:hypothetical protein